MTSAQIEIGATSGAARPAKPQWGGIVNRYQQTVLWKAIAQMATTFVPMAALFWLMYRSLSVSYALTLLLAIPTAGLLVRTFIIMHDCGHGSFFKSRRANEIVGWITGVLTLTPFAQWRKDHALHHASSGDLDRRGHGDIETKTVAEYLAMTPKDRRKYRFVRHPFVMLVLGPLYLMLNQRRMIKGVEVNQLQRFSVYSTNVGIAVIATAFSLWIGFPAFFAVYFPAIYLAASAGIMLFYVQHQFEDTYWNEHREWDYATAAIQGSSYFKLNPVLQWFTGNIGLHHVHHLGPRIPNYNLKRCHDENEMFHSVTVLTIPEAMRTMRLRLWDAEERRLIGIRELEERARAHDARR
ncbi:MAG TPA: fatty acid desaturase [Gemmatimonadaceae bacterium]|nr:fatty acid desaturase [Gemmatimonadaceae bacterium]